MLFKDGMWIVKEKSELVKSEQFLSLEKGKSRKQLEISEILEEFCFPFCFWVIQVLIL